MADEFLTRTWTF